MLQQPQPCSFWLDLSGFTVGGGKIIVEVPYSHRFAFILKQNNSPSGRNQLQIVQVGLLQWLHLHVDDSQSTRCLEKWKLRGQGALRRALGRRVLREALDEPWPWLSGKELMWRTGLFDLGSIGFGSHPVYLHTSGLTVHKQLQRMG